MARRPVQGSRSAEDLRQAGALFNQGRAKDAADAAARIVARDPKNAGAHQLLALARLALGEPERARYHADRAVAATPSNPGAHLALAQVALKANDLARAEQAARKTVELNPDLAQAWEMLALIQRSNGDHARAIAALDRALAIDANRPTAAVQRGVLDLEGGRVHDATDRLIAAAKRFPTFPEAHTKLAYSLIHDDRAEASSIRDAHARWGQIVEQHTPAARPTGSAEGPDDRLTVAYLSPDLRQHSVSAFLLPLIEHHDNAAVRTVAYSTATNTDAVSDRLRDAFDTWRDLAQASDDDLARAAANDGVDILVELTGHFSRNRLRAMARRLAPVQATYLGYPATTGLTRIDARIVDHHTDPEAQGDTATENLVRLDRCFLCYAGPFAESEVNPTPAFERTGAFTFGSFNNAKKVGPAVIAAWAKVLERSPGAHLTLKGRGYDDVGVADRVLGEFERLGIKRDRVRILPRTDAVADHLRAYDNIDLALDTFPYNGTTTTCEAAWMGVPTVTPAGAHHAARVGVSLNHAMGLDAFTTDDIDGYIERASGLADDPRELIELRPAMRSRLRTSPMMDAEPHARAIEAAYRSLWRAHLERGGAG